MKYKGDLIRFLIWNIICLCIVIFTGYMGKSKFPIIDTMFILGIFNIIIYLRQTVKKLGFFNLSKHAFSNFWGIVMGAIHKEDYQIKEYDFTKNEDGDNNPFYLWAGVVLILTSIISYIL